ncbi:MAG: Hsp33 family molecular chaperone HslO [Wenzhouxiangellaceae bacterium]
MNDDHLQRLLLEQANVRCVVAHLDTVYSEVLQRGRYPDLLASLLGESLVVAALCSSGVKFEGRVSLQLRASGAVKLLMADCTDDGGLRGLARFDADALLAVREFSEIAQGGVLTMTVEPAGKGRMWQGIVPLEGNSMAEAIAGYFDQSEQLPTRVILAVNESRAAGLLLQRLPGNADDDDGWNRVCRLIETVSDRELLETDSETLLHRLFHEETRRLFPARPLQFYCPCSRERVAQVLRGLGTEELDDIVESEGRVDVSCEFCNQKYSFDPLDVRRILHSDLPEQDDDNATVH